MEVDWSNLLPELLETISRELTNYADYVRFRAVCVNWRSNVSPTPRHILFQFPWLMLPSEPHNENRRGFFSLLENKVHQLNIPNTHNPLGHCCGSSLGWLLFLDERSPALFLFNPLTSIQILLPPLTAFPDVLDFNILNVGNEYLLRSSFSQSQTFTRSLDNMHDYFIRRFALSSSPTSLNEDYVVVAIVNCRMELAFCKKGDKTWTTIKHAGLLYWDLTYHQGLLNAVNLDGTIAICNVSGISPLVTIIKPAHSIECDRSHLKLLHLVHSSGELLLINRFFRHNSYNRYSNIVYKTVGFEVFRFDSSKRAWEELKSLGDRMLFVGASSSLCLLATNFDRCEGNCIYFTGGSYQDSGVFNVGDCSIKALPYCIGSQTPLSPSIWLTPNPC